MNYYALSDWNQRNNRNMTYCQPRIPLHDHNYTADHLHQNDHGQRLVSSARPPLWKGLVLLRTPTCVQDEILS